jgi:dolichol-phosphate mannosyltransferase
VDYRLGNFGIYSKKVIQSILKLNEYNRSFGLFAIWVGFKRIEIDVVHSKREKGKSAYTFRKMFNLAFDSIIAHSNKLLKISVKTGFVLSTGSILSGLFLVVRYILYPIPLLGYASLIVSIFFLAGLVISSIGILGLYIEKIFNEVKRRPLYLIESTANITTGAFGTQPGEF